MAKSAIIVGGSNAGLMCGIMLKRHGYDVTILEKAVRDDRQGFDAGIKIGPAVHEFLDKHSDVKEEFTVICSAAVKFNIEGKAKSERSQTFTSTSWGCLYNVLRANFDGYTSRAVTQAPTPRATDGNAIYRTGAQVTDVKDIGSSVEVYFTNVNDREQHTLTSELVIIADGSTSAIRGKLLPQVQRRYAGYVAWRGTVKERMVDDECNERYACKLAMHRMSREYLLHYTIPTDDRALEPGERLHNWIWYRPVKEGSGEMHDIFTDVDGVQHQGTVPRGKLRSDVWTKQKELTSSGVPPELAQIIVKSSTPFLTKIYDAISPKATLFGNKLFLVGDAQSSIRPNAGTSTTHAANDCNHLELLIEGQITPAQWEKAVLRYAAAQQAFGKVIAAFGLGSKLAAIWYALLWLLLLLRQTLGIA